MGLDITAYRQIEFIRPALGDDDYDYTNGELSLYVNSDFRERADGLQNGIYKSKDHFSFRAGSYSGYNEWRRGLAELMNKTDQEIFDDPQPGPFIELINFSDCEGVIGPATSAKLAKDFAEYDAKAQEVGGWWYEGYQRWRQAFEMAADNGCVEFH